MLLVIRRKTSFMKGLFRRFDEMDNEASVFKHKRGQGGHWGTISSLITQYEVVIAEA